MIKLSVHDIDASVCIEASLKLAMVLECLAVGDSLPGNMYYDSSSASELKPQSSVSMAIYFLVVYC